MMTVHVQKRFFQSIYLNIYIFRKSESNIFCIVIILTSSSFCKYRGSFKLVSSVISSSSAVGSMYRSINCLNFSLLCAIDTFVPQITKWGWFLSGTSWFSGIGSSYKVTSHMKCFTKMQANNFICDIYHTRSWYKQSIKKFFIRTVLQFGSLSTHLITNFWCYLYQLEPPRPLPCAYYFTF